MTLYIRSFSTLPMQRPFALGRALFSKLRHRQQSLTKDELDAVLGHYDLGRWSRGKTLRRATSCSVALATDQGRIIVKRYHGAREKVLREHALLNYLTATDIPCPQVHVNSYGRSWTEVGGRLYAVYGLIEGFSFDACLRDLGTEELLVREAGKALARLDQAMAGLLIDGPIELRRLFAEQWPNMEWRLNLVERYQKEATEKQWQDGKQAFLQSIAQEVCQALLEAREYYRQAIPQLPFQMVHYDFVPKNVLFDREGPVAAILDFGNACVDMRAANVARGVFSFSHILGSRLDRRVTTHFLKGYEREQPLLDEEIMAMPDLMRWRWLRRLVRVMESSLDSSPQDRRPMRYSSGSVRETWNNIRWIERHREDLQTLLFLASRS